MAELLHKKNLSEPGKQAIAPHEVLQQINIEDEFALELNSLKNTQYLPRPAAVAQLLQMIHTQTVVEH